MSIDVILPAGGRIPDEFAVEAGADIKALIPFHGQTLLEQTLDVIHATECLGHTVVIGPEEVLSHPAAKLADAVLPDANSGPENIFRGIDWLTESNGGRYPERVLILTTDLPFITPESLTDFLNACPTFMDICAPLIHREEFQGRFPDSSNVFLKLCDGEWTLGCSFLVNPAAIVANRQHIENIFKARKSQFAMARLLGLTFIVSFLMRRLTIDQIERRCADILNCTSRGIRGCAPELAFDIDLPEEYRYAVSHKR